MSYRFDSSKLQISQTSPDSSASEEDKCNPASSAVSYGGYSDIIQSDVSGKFIVTPTSMTAPKTVGKATIVLTIINGTQTTNMQTSVSFRDYNNIVQ